MKFLYVFTVSFALVFLPTDKIMADSIALSHELTENDVTQLFEQSFIGTHVTNIADHLENDFQVAYLADGSAAIHVEIKPTNKPPFTTVKYVIVVAYEDGFASEIRSVERGLIGL